jgi:hypothetical protein
LGIIFLLSYFCRLKTSVGRSCSSHGPAISVDGAIPTNNSLALAVD